MGGRLPHCSSAETHSRQCHCWRGCVFTNEPAGGCLSRCLPGAQPIGTPVWFVRCYGVSDSFKEDHGKDSTFCGITFADWLRAVEAAPSDIWPENISSHDRTLWSARLFPAEPSQESYPRWLWMFDVSNASPEQKREFLAADRYSAEDCWRGWTKTHFIRGDRKRVLQKSNGR